MSFVSFTRQSLELLPPVSLPLYVRSCGLRGCEKGEIITQTAERHSFCSISICLSGTGFCRVYQQDFLLTPGKAIFYYPKESRQFISESEDWQLLWFTFDGPLAASLMMSYEYPRVNAVDLNLVKRIYEKLCVLLPDSDVLKIRVASNLMQELIGSFSLETAPDKNTGVLLENIKRFINDNLSNPSLDVNMVGEHFQINRSTLNRFFLARMERTLHAYIDMCRFLEAKALLSASELTVKQIAGHCGYRELSTFCRSFRKRFQETPSEYREKVRFQ